MFFRRRSALCLRLSLLLAAGVTGWAGPVSPFQAEAAVARWLQVTPRPLQLALSSGVDQVVTHRDAEGAPLFHEVRLAGGGFVVVASDDLLEPVIAFSGSGRLETGAGSLLDLMLRSDLGRRLADLKTAPPLEAAGRPGRRKWDLLQDTGSEPVAMALTTLATVNDLRVAPLVQSRWNQETAAGLPAFNYFAPNQYPIGCVATAIGQLMRFHQFPTLGVGVRTLNISVDEVSQRTTTRGGDGAGGAYNWGQMPLVVGASATDAERQMIGALLFDTAASVNMSFKASGSGAVTGRGSGALRNTFLYANALYGYNGGSELVGHGLQEMVQPNLDAGLPVVLAILASGASSGHAVVCDGYGYNTGSLYHHLNLGWGGNSDAWYNLPAIATAAGNTYNVITGCLYNVFKTGTGDIISGRVTDASGNPVAGVQVGNGTLTSTTGANGIYALVHTTPGIQTLSAAKAGATFTQTVRVTDTLSVDYGTVGNLWGMDLVQSPGLPPVIQVQPVAQEVKLGDPATFKVGASGTGPLHFQWSKNGAAVGSDSPVYTTGPTVAGDDQAQVLVKVVNAQGETPSAAARLAATYLFNGSFELGAQGWNLYDASMVLGIGSYAFVQPHSNSHWLCLGDWTGPVTDYATQDVAIPATATAANFSFWLGIANKTKTPATAANTLAVKVLDATGGVLATLMTRDNTAADTGGNGLVTWKACGPFNLLPYKGRAVTLRLESTQAGATDTGTIFALDDLTLAVATAASASVAPGATTLVTGGHATFTAAVTGFQADNHVAWTTTAGAGTFSPATTAGDGVTATTFTGGATPGTFTLTATPVETGGLPATTAVTLVAPASVNVALTPGTATVLAGAPVTFTSTVSLLTDHATDWSRSGGAFTATGANTATWSSPVAGTFTITAASSAASTQKASAQVTVLDAAGIQLGLNVAGATVLPAGSLALTATGDLGYGVTWTVTGGATHSDNGTTTTVTLPAALPLVAATYTITATSKADATRTASAVLTVKAMDFNADASLDPRDLLVLAREWGQGLASPANLKGSGTVDDTDLNALLSRM
jgi:hypothetical protein